MKTKHQSLLTLVVIVVASLSALCAPFGGFAATHSESALSPDSVTSVSIPSYKANSVSISVGWGNMGCKHPFPRPHSELAKISQLVAVSYDYYYRSDRAYGILATFDGAHFGFPVDDGYDWATSRLRYFYIAPQFIGRVYTDKHCEFVLRGGVGYTRCVADVELESDGNVKSKMIKNSFAINGNMSLNIFIVRNFGVKFDVGLYIGDIPPCYTAYGGTKDSPYGKTSLTAGLFFNF